MNGSPMGTILEMVQLLISNTIGTLMGVGKLFAQLVNQLGFVSITAGTGGFILSVIILGVVIFFLGKFILSSGKALVILFALGFIALFLMFGSLI